MVEVKSLWSEASLERVEGILFIFLSSVEIGMGMLPILNEGASKDVSSLTCILEVWGLWEIVLI